MGFPSPNADIVRVVLCRTYTCTASHCRCCWRMLFEPVLEVVLVYTEHITDLYERYLARFSILYTVERLRRSARIMSSGVSICISQMGDALTGCAFLPLRFGSAFTDAVSQLSLPGALHSLSFVTALCSCVMFSAFRLLFLYSCGKFLRKSSWDAVLCLFADCGAVSFLSLLSDVVCAFSAKRCLYSCAFSRKDEFCAADVLCCVVVVVPMSSIDI